MQINAIKYIMVLRSVFSNFSLRILFSDAKSCRVLEVFDISPGESNDTAVKKERSFIPWKWLGS